jgi:hypothetical protein
MDYYYAAVFLASVAAIVYWFSNYKGSNEEKKNWLQAVLACLGGE